MTREFTRAVRPRRLARVALAGPAGAGLTYTGLVFGCEFAELAGGRCAVIDTTDGDALDYARLFDFDHLLLEPPFTPEAVGGAVTAAAIQGYEAVVVDHLSSEYEGPGGLLEIVDELTRSLGGDQNAAWAEAGARHSSMMKALRHAPTHLVVTVRSRQETVVDVGADGLKTSRRLGLAPIQRSGIEHEFQVFAEMDVDHRFTVTRTTLSELADMRGLALPDVGTARWLHALAQDGEGDDDNLGMWRRRMGLLKALMPDETRAAASEGWRLQGFPPASAIDDIDVARNAHAYLLDMYRNGPSAATENADARSAEGQAV